MRINNIQNSSLNVTNINFKGFQRTITKPNKGLLYRNDTWFFRNEGFWNDLTTFLKEKYKHIPKVNVYNYGCSDGSEPLSFVMKILAYNDKDLEKKFLPITAKDIDEFVIKKAKSKDYFFLKQEERDKINLFTNGQFKKFFSEIDTTLNGCFAYANPNLYNHINFSVADIKKDFKNIKPENSIVFVRNFWPYIKPERRIINTIKKTLNKNSDEITENRKARLEILKNLFSHLEKNSLIIIGDFDEKQIYNFEQEIQDAGFKKTTLKYVFEKV